VEDHALDVGEDAGAGLLLLGLVAVVVVRGGVVQGAGVAVGAGVLLHCGVGSDGDGIMGD